MFFKYNAYTIAWALIIFFLILLPGQHLPQIDQPKWISVDKLAHAFVFFVLTLLMIIGFYKQFRFKSLRNNPERYALSISVGYALILESMQFLSSARMVEMMDAAANVSGCLLGWMGFYIIYKI